MGRPLAVGRTTFAKQRCSESTLCFTKGGSRFTLRGMGYAILRTQKLKSAVAVRRSMKHAFREQDTPNADAARTPGNTHIGAQSADEGLAKVGALLPEKRRSDAVLCVEYLVTGSPEAMNGKSRAEQDAYLLDALEWIKERHGGANVVYAGIHRDETTPHLYAYAVPLDPDTGRLNAKRWLGGAKALSQMQTDFADRVGRRHGLERGIEGSKAKHQRVQQYYAALTKKPETPAIDVPDPGMADRLNPRAYGERVAQAVIDQVQPVHSALQARAATAEADRKRAAEMAATAKAARAETDRMRDKLATLQKWADPILKLAQASPEAAKEFYRQVQERTAALRGEKKRSPKDRPLGHGR